MKMNNMRLAIKSTAFPFHMRGTDQQRADALIRYFLGIRGTWYLNAIKDLGYK